MKSEECAFIAALRAVSRGACERWIREQCIDEDDAVAYETAKGRWQSDPHLSDPELHTLSVRVLEASRGPYVDGTTPLTTTIWRSGATDTRNGETITGPISDFVTEVLETRARVIKEKRRGWVVTPTTCSDGHRVNASTLAVHALNLDCDGRGEWTTLLNGLAKIDLTYIAYQSGGWSPTAPKWHILIPLAHAFDTSTPEKIAQWKTAYNTARVVFGSIANILGEGFDPTVETPGIPIFITERRAESDPPRAVVWRAGHSLDLEVLVTSLPSLPPEEKVEREFSISEIEPLDDARLEQVVAALCAPMSKILSDRRTLYLALPGDLLDRGLSGDDVLTIIESISERCPGDPNYTPMEIASKHREHLHCARTTISKHERGEAHTQIGTLVSGWPEIATALDTVLPRHTEIEKSINRISAYWSQRRQAKVVQAKAAMRLVSPSEIYTQLQQARQRKLSKLKKLTDTSTRSASLLKFHSVLLKRLLLGTFLDDRASDDEITGAEPDKVVEAAMDVVGNCVKVGTPFGSVIEITGRSLGMMGCTASLEKMKQAEKAFDTGMQRRSEYEEKARANKFASRQMARLLPE